MPQNITKFSNYLFDSVKAPGKGAVFENLGYSVDDSEALAKLYQEQALQ
jgi:hypothetical protein